jgi:hypothetical protein
MTRGGLREVAGALERRHDDRDRAVALLAAVEEPAAAGTIQRDAWWSASVIGLP